MILIINIHKFNSKHYKNFNFYKFITLSLKILFVILLFYINEKFNYNFYIHL